MEEHHYIMQRIMVKVKLSDIYWRKEQMPM